MNNKYVKLHSILRMLAALLAIVTFISMFIADQAYLVGFGVNYNFETGAFFGSDTFNCSGNVLAFFGYLFVLLGGLAGLAFVFIDEIIGKELTNKLSFVAGALAVLGAIFIFLFAPIFSAINHFNSGDCRTTAAPIVFGIFALLIGAANIASPILEKKGKQSKQNYHPKRWFFCAILK